MPWAALPNPTQDYTPDVDLPQRITHDAIVIAYPNRESDHIRAASRCAAWRTEEVDPAAEIRLLVHMNLAPSWVVFLQEEGFEAVQWSGVGNRRPIIRADR
jgi:hypothetical protein